jgi:hypothetical protein
MSQGNGHVVKIRASKPKKEEYAPQKKQKTRNRHKLTHRELWKEQ